jgi:hypothetical protein
VGRAVDVLPVLDIDAADGAVGLACPGLDVDVGVGANVVVGGYRDDPVGEAKDVLPNPAPGLACRHDQACQKREDYPDSEEPDPAFGSPPFRRNGERGRYRLGGLLGGCWCLVGQVRSWKVE